MAAGCGTARSRYMIRASSADNPVYALVASSDLLIALPSIRKVTARYLERIFDGGGRRTLWMRYMTR